MLDSVLARKVSRTVEKFNRLVPWYKLPSWLGIAYLSELRDTLRAENLFDTSRIDAGAGHRHEDVDPPPAGAALLCARRADGSYNDLESPRMGMAGSRFGRNVPLDAVRAPGPSEVLRPNPRVVSERLLARHTFVPATSLNVLAAAWIQFMSRDWFSHGEGDAKKPYVVPLSPEDPWPEHPMQIARTRRDPTRCPMSPGIPTFTNDVTHWWDASQVYGSDASLQTRLRALQGGKLKLTSGGQLLRDEPTGAELTGFITDTSWAPISLLHTLFAREHNAICDALAAAYPSWDDEALFEHARLVNAALLAKIHTEEWTPALLTHEPIASTMSASWRSMFDARSGTPHGADHAPAPTREHFGVPYAITEELVSVHRMHSLVPDALILRSLRDPTHIRHATLTDLLGANGTRLIGELGVDDLLYSFGRAHPGALRLHNYPNLLRDLIRHDGSRVDLAAVDVLRDRERGVPRYAAFRRLFQLPVPRSFEELTDEPRWARELAAVYTSVEDVDLLTGMLAEPLPEGMALGETAFRVIFLMASRRLSSDRFFTTDFTDEVYSPVGMAWIRDNGLKSVLLRHVPALAPALAHTKNAFWPWNAVRQS